MAWRIALSRSSFSLAEFVDYNLSLVFPNVHLVRSASGSEMFVHLMRVREGDAVIAISFPRYSKRIIKAADFAASRGANVVAITDGPTSPIAKCSSAALYAKSDMASFADSLVAPLSVINALLAAIGMKPSRKVELRNGALDCEYWKYEIFAGKRNDFVRKKKEKK